MEIVLASANQGKIHELGRLLASMNVRVVGMDVFEVSPVDEDGTTFYENACKKALHCVTQTGRWALAEDSGLEVEVLGGRPGVYSARFAGEEATDAQNNTKLLYDLRGVAPPKRTARFRCVMVLASPEGALWTAEGVCPGRICTELRGEGGFGYDPLFVPDGFDRTFAEMDPDEKSAISHRGKALASLAKMIASLRRG